MNLFLVYILLNCVHKLIVCTLYNIKVLHIFIYAKFILKKFTKKEEYLCRYTSFAIYTTLHGPLRYTLKRTLILIGLDINLPQHR